MSTTPVPSPLINDVDEDGHTWKFVKQEFTNSCGPACLSYAKSLFHDVIVDESEGRKTVSRVEPRRPIGMDQKTQAYGAALQRAAGDTSLRSVKRALKYVLAPDDADGAHERRAYTNILGDRSWQFMGTKPELLVEALRREPAAIPNARLISGGYREALWRSSPKCPAIIAVFWTREFAGAPTDGDKTAARAATSGTGGHFILCVGPTSSKTRLLVIDPQQGVRYIEDADVTDTCLLYTGSTKIGKAEVAYQRNPKPVAVDDSRVEYVARGRYSRCGVIVTWAE